ncbi:hypothetical protein CE91St65_37050 [[Clostridium] symbiosum]|jgi:uncharacterized protein YjcR|uniref:phage terminase small subunit-related protein n=1 Tax=Clostridium symbiosum TaxID=1512 RepID=UPI001FCB5ACD|nr:hypothetical protein CE91St65_37050 [[Clostridium] symbiosum]BDF30730.1 hypothetical protein CE91St66_37070 [[Clostridium] symbiosum]
MGRPRKPERDQALQQYLDSDGNISTKELAVAAGVPEARIRKWKSEDKWEECLKNRPRKKGGQHGNKNAAGKTPAKEGNRNAVTHGAYVQPGYEDIDPDKAQEIRQLRQGDSLARMLAELQQLLVREAYLNGLLEEYKAADAEGRYYPDKVVHMIVPKTVEDIEQEDAMGVDAGQAADPEGKGKEKFKTAMKTIIKASPFDRTMKVEGELNRLNGRIIKLLDSMKAYEIEDRRLKLEEKKYQLAKQKATGEFNFDDPEDGGAEDMDPEFPE